MFTLKQMYVEDLSVFNTATLESPVKRTKVQSPRVSGFPQQGKVAALYPRRNLCFQGLNRVIRIDVEHRDFRAVSHFDMVLVSSFNW